MPILAMLVALPCLTTLKCTDVRLNAEDMIAIAAHASLEHIALTFRQSNHRYSPWLPVLSFNSDEAQDEKQPERAATAIDDTIAASSLTEDEAYRLTVAVSRAKPSTERSVSARLALVDFLSRALPRTADVSHRRQVAFLRQRLHAQRDQYSKKRGAAAGERAANSSGYESQQRRKRDRDDEVTASPDTKKEKLL